MSRSFNVPVSEWRRQFYAELKGAPTVASLKKAIDAGEIPGASIAGKYHVCCKANYELDYSKLEIKTFRPDPKPKITNTTAANILSGIGIQ